MTNRADILEALAERVETRPLRLCGYCQTWNRRPCGDQCSWSLNDPTFEAVERAACANAAQTDPYEAAIRLIISAYHTTRMAEVPAAEHIMSRVGHKVRALLVPASGIAARSDETLQAAQPEGQEPARTPKTSLEKNNG